MAACHQKEPEVVQKERVFEGFHPLMDEIVRSKKGVFRGLDLNSKADAIKSVETAQPI